MPSATSSTVKAGRWRRSHRFLRGRTIASFCLRYWSVIRRPTGFTMDLQARRAKGIAERRGGCSRFQFEYARSSIASARGHGARFSGRGSVVEGSRPAMASFIAWICLKLHPSAVAASTRGRSLPPDRPRNRRRVHYGGAEENGRCLHDAGEWARRLAQFTLSVRTENRCVVGSGTSSSWSSSRRGFKSARRTTGNSMDSRRGATVRWMFVSARRGHEVRAPPFARTARWYGA